MDTLTEIHVCEVCENRQLHSVLNFGKQPLCDDLVPLQETRHCEEYPIEILFCQKCLTGHQRFQVPKQNLFPKTYHYRSRFTSDVLQGMASLVAACEQRLGSLQDKTIVDVGCNDGSLLNFFREKGARTIGIEPTEAYLDAEKNGHHVYNAFLDKSISETIVKKHGPIDIITFTNVFAHIENLNEVLASLKAMMAPHTLLVIENHYLGSILKDYQFDTFYHEHPRTYSFTSFEYIAKSLGMTLLDVEFPSRYGGNIRVYLGNSTHHTFPMSANLPAIKQKEAGFMVAFQDMQHKIDAWKKNKRTMIDEYVKNYGRLQVKAFPGRAAILIKLLDINEDQLFAVYEKPGSLKIGHYVPGTRVPILSDEALSTTENKTKPLLNLAWHIPKEIRDYMKAQGFTGPILDIVTLDDFSTKGLPVT